MPSISIPVAASTDDCRYNASIPSFVLNQIDNWFGNRFFSGNQDWQTGMRFLGITIPKNATIVSATLTFKARITDASTGVNLRIEGEAVDDAATFVDAANFTARPRTTANASWSPGSWVSGTSYVTADFAAVIQELVNRAGWVSGNDLVLFVKDNGSDQGADHYRIAYAYDNAAGDAPILDIVYSDAAETNPAIQVTNTMIY